MVARALVDAGLVIALLSRRDQYHGWAMAESSRLPPPWKTCDAVLSEAFHLLGSGGQPALRGLLRRGAVVLAFDLAHDLDRVLGLMGKYANVPMSLADACLVRMSETVADAVVLTTETDFQIYRRHGRQVVPCVTPR